MMIHIVNLASVLHGRVDLLIESARHIARNRVLVNQLARLQTEGTRQLHFKGNVSLLNL
jgi:hypothetical protein